MDGSLMFIIYPSSLKDEVTVSVRTAGGHDTPDAIFNIRHTVQNVDIENSIMKANVICHNCTSWPGDGSIDLASTKQAWIWAAGPGKLVSSDSQSANLDKHESYGVFFADMTKAQATSDNSPSISGTGNINVRAQPGSVQTMVIIHAILFVGSFFVLFPLGVIALRWRGWFKAHWLLQLIATAICAFGLMVGVAISIMSVEYASFDEAHQIIGIAVVAVLLVQAVLGYLHHANYKKLGQRTMVSHVHLWTGRVIILVGMVDSVLGFLLVKETGIAIGIAIVAVAIFVAMTVLNLICMKRQKKSTFTDLGSSTSIALSNYNNRSDANAAGQLGTHREDDEEEHGVPGSPHATSLFDGHV